MSLTPSHLAGFALLLAASTPAPADSLASSASSAGSASSASLSDSVHASSNSSRRDDRVADGDYRVVALADLPGRPGMLRLTLQALAEPGADGSLWLDLPRQALAQQALAPGDTVSARHRDYGIEFARADTRQPFFLALADDWVRELQARPVVR